MCFQHGISEEGILNIILNQPKPLMLNYMDWLRQGSRIMQRLFFLFPGGSQAFAKFLDV